MRIDDDPVAQQRPSHIGDQYVRDHAHSRHDGDVDLGMTEEPEQVLPQQRRAAGMGLQLIVDDEVRGHKETGTGNVVQNEQNAGRHQHRKRRQTDAGGNEPGPDGERQAHQAHAFAAHVERGGDEVQRAQQLADAEDGDGNRPQDLAGSLSGTCDRTQRAQRSVSRPTGERRPLGHEERRHGNDERDKRHPERHHVDVRETACLRRPPGWAESNCRSPQRERW